MKANPDPIVVLPTTTPRSAHPGTRGPCIIDDHTAEEVALDARFLDAGCLLARDDVLLVWIGDVDMRVKEGGARATGGAGEEESLFP